MTPNFSSPGGWSGPAAGYEKHQRRILIEHRVLTVNSGVDGVPVAIPGKFQAASRFFGKAHLKALNGAHAAIFPNGSGANCNFGLLGALGNVTNTADFGLRFAAGPTGATNLFSATFEFDNIGGVGGKQMNASFLTYGTYPTINNHGTFHSVYSGGAITSLTFTLNAGGLAVLADSEIWLYAEMS